MRKTLRLAAILILSLICISGCSGLGSDFEKPTVSVSNLRFEDVTLFETSMVFKMRVTNDNPFPITIDGSTHEIYLNGVYIGKGRNKNRFTVEKLDSSVQEVVVQLSNFSMLTNIRSLVEQPKLSYRVESKMFVDRGFGTGTVSSIDEGEFATGSK